MLVIKNLALTIAKDFRPLLQGFDFTLQPGSKVALIGEEGNGKSTLLKAIYDQRQISSYVEIEGEIQKAGEIIGYLPQELTGAQLNQTALAYFEQRAPRAYLDYADYYELLSQLNLPEDRIQTGLCLADLSGGEKIKLQLLCEMLKRPTALLLDEPSNDLDLESVKWLETFILEARIPIMFVAHDELLLQNCANTIIHLEQLMRKKLPQHTIVRSGYVEYVRARRERLRKQTQVAQKEREQYADKMARYRQIYARVQHELRTASRQAPSVAKNLKDKMHSVKAMGKRFEREKDGMTKRPDFEDSIAVDFDGAITIPRGKLVLDLRLAALKVGERVLSRELKLTIFGPQKVCIIGANGAGKTTLLRQVLRSLGKGGLRCGYMPQDYAELMDPQKNAIEFLAKTQRTEELTEVRTYLGSMNFTAEEMFRPLVELSGGQRAKLYFSKMILDRAEVLVLDEPTRNLSPLSGPEVRAALKGFGGCIIAVSHDRKFITEVCEQVLLLDETGLGEIDLKNPDISWA